jgi:hypothetical protein
MTKHSMVTLRLHRKGVILVVVFSLLLAVLIFFAGFLFGTRRGGSSFAVAKPTLPKVAVPQVAVPKVAVPKVAAPKLPALAVPAVTATRAAALGGEALGEVVAQNAVAVRAGMFPDEADAKALVQRLAAGKIAATIVPMPMDSGPTLYLVLVGRYTNRREAAAAASWLANEYALETAVMPVE